MKNRDEAPAADLAAPPATGDTANPVKLRRVLTLTDLIIYGIILIQPVAALPLFGHADDISRGHAVTAVLAAMVAMCLTAVSYGRMANRYPAAGSAYTYVSKGIHPYLGFVAGWCMFMDYLFIPILCVIYGSITAYHLLPFVPYYAWIFLFAAAFTLLNLKGMKVTAGANRLLMIVMSVVVFYFMAAAIRYIFIRKGWSGLLSIDPLYNKASFSLSALGSATALAALTYIGFDGITTLSEEAHNPKRNVLLAAVITCLITGVWSGAQVYLAQLSWPDYTAFTSGAATEAAKNNALDTAIMAVAGRVGGSWLDAALAFTLLIGSVGSGITAQIGASRLLYGMGRDGVLPPKVFGHLDRKHASPIYNIIIVGLLALAGALAFSYEEGAGLINFGAFFAFMGVNLAALREYFILSKKKTVKLFLVHALLPALGFVFCLIIWLNLPLRTFWVGGIWMAVGIIYLAVRTGGFRKKAMVVDFS